MSYRSFSSFFACLLRAHYVSKSFILENCRIFFHFMIDFETDTYKKSTIEKVILSFNKDFFFEISNLFIKVFKQIEWGNWLLKKCRRSF